MNKIILILFLSLSSAKLFAQENNKLTLIPVVGYSSQMITDGLVTWDKPIYIAAIGFSYWRFSAGKGGLNFSLYRDKTHNLNLSYGGFSDDEPKFPIIKTSHDNRSERDIINRKDTNYYGFNYTYNIPMNLRISFKYTKDVKANLSENSSISIAKTVFMPLIRVNFTQGFGGREHNRYLYGPSADGGTSFYRYGLSVILPFLPGGGRLINAVHFYEFNRKTIREAEYIDGNHRVNSISSTAMWFF